MPTIKLYVNLRTIAEHERTMSINDAPFGDAERTNLLSRGANLGAVLNELIKQVPALDGSSSWETGKSVRILSSPSMDTMLPS